MNEQAEHAGADTERDPDVIHLLPVHRFVAGDMTARCGFDVSGRRPRHYERANCVVCLSLAGRS
jgi:hypothetical protein